MTRHPRRPMSVMLIVSVLSAWMAIPAFEVIPGDETAEAHPLPCGSSTPIGPNNCWESKAWAGGNTGALSVIRISGRDLAGTRPQSEFIKAGIWVSNGAGGGQDCTGQSFGYCWIELQLRKRSQELDAWFWADKRSNSNFFEHFISIAGSELNQDNVLAIYRNNSTTWTWLIDFGANGSAQFAGSSTSNNLIADHIEIGMQIKSTAQHYEIVLNQPLNNRWVENSYRVGSNAQFDFQSRDPDFARDCSCITSNWISPSGTWPGGSYDAYITWN